MIYFLLKEADEDGGGGLDLDEFRQAMVKTMAGKGELVGNISKGKGRREEMKRV